MRLSFLIPKLTSHLPSVDHKSMLKRYRALMVTIGILYPLWRFGAYYLNPNANETWEERGMIGVFFLTFAGLTYWTDYLRRNVAIYFNIINYIWFIHVFYLLVINDLSSEYMFVSIVVIFTSGASFLDASAMLWYYLMCICLTGSLVIQKPEPYRMTFFLGIIAALATSYIGLRSLLGLFKQLAENKNALQKRTDEFTALSTAVQTLFLPDKQELKTEHWHIAGYYRPVDGCGGDWWSYFEHNKKLTILVGDVTGHGPGPAMMTASIASYTRALQTERPDLTLNDILHALNKYLIELQTEKSGQHHYLMTVHALEIDLNTKKISSWSTGAPGAAIYDAAGAVRFIGQQGSPLGLRADLQIGYDSCDFMPGDRIFLFTDGIAEMNLDGAVRLSERKFFQMAAQDRDLGPLQSAHAFVNKLDKMRGANEQEDDYTLIMLDMA